MNNRNAPFELEKGIEGIIKDYSKITRKTHYPNKIKPAHYKTTDLFEKITHTAYSLDSLILKELQPVIEDNYILDPSNYQSILYEAIAFLHNKWQETNEPPYRYCADMINQEAELVIAIHIQKIQAR